MLSVRLNGVGAQLDLVVSVEPELASGTGSAVKKVLLANVQSVELSYFGKGRSDRAAAWRQGWMGERTLPQLVRIRVRFAARRRSALAGAGRSPTHRRRCRLRLRSAHQAVPGTIDASRIEPRGREG